MNSSKSTNKNNSKNNVVTAKESFHGYIETTRDSLLLFEACKRGIIPRISRRLQDKERHLIRSGSIFCFDEKESGIKRWTDGLIWSPSRILGNFLIYRELDDKKFVRSNSTDHSIMQRQHQHDNGVGATTTTTTTTTNNNMDHDDDVTMRSRSSSLSSCNSSIAAMASGYVGAPDLLRRQREKALLGSLKTSYKFKKNGLIKKSMSLIVDGVQQHIISYYSKEDVLSCRLKTPSSLVELSSLEVSPSLRLRQNFRIPNFLSEENTSDDRFMEDYQQKNNNKRKYSDFIKPLEYDLGSSPSSFTSSIPSNSVNMNGPADDQYNSTQSSVIKVPNDLYPPVTHTNTTSYPTPSCQLPSIPEAFLPLSVFDDRKPNYAPHQGSNILLCNTGNASKSNGMLAIEEPSLSQAQFNNNRATQFTKDKKPQQDANLIENAIITNQNITSAMSFSNTNTKKRQLVSPTTSNDNGTSINFLNNSNVTADTTASSVIHNNFMPATTSGGYYSSAYYDNDQGQNPHQHLFSSSSFHAVNHAAMPNRTEIATNAFMFDINMLLGTGWNEFELQM